MFSNKPDESGKKSAGTNRPNTESTTPPADSNEARRKLVQSLSLGAAGASTFTWVKPVVESVVLPAHALTTSPPDSTPEICRLLLEGCEVNCLSGDGQELNYYLESRLYTLEVRDGCPRVANVDRSCCEYDLDVLTLTPGANQVLIRCVQFSFEQAPTGVNVSVFLPEQSEPYAEGEWECALDGGGIEIPGGVETEVIEVDGVSLQIRAEISVSAGTVTLNNVVITPA